MDKESNTNVDSTNLVTLLLIAFIVLKLTGVITWSWWWVLSPLWIPIILTGIIMVIVWIKGEK